MLLYFLGDRGRQAPSLRRNVTSTALKLPEPNKAVWLFDCGEGTQHQLLSSPFSLRQVTEIFVTHLHGDHIFRLPDFWATVPLSPLMWGWQCTVHPGLPSFSNAPSPSAAPTCGILSKFRKRCR